MTTTQLPLKLCWALTMHKSQRQRLDKAVVDLSKREACTGLTFACLSRVKQIDDLLVTAMPFDRIGRLGQSPVLQARRVEEARLRRLAVQTRQRLGERPVSRGEVLHRRLGRRDSHWFRSKNKNVITLCSFSSFQNPADTSNIYRKA